jgi:hypothetical protein
MVCLIKISEPDMCSSWILEQKFITAAMLTVEFLLIDAENCASFLTENAGRSFVELLS